MPKLNPQNEEEAQLMCERALALRAVIEMFGEDITEDAEYTAALMELYLKGYYAAKP